MRIHDKSLNALIGVARRDVTPPVGIYNRSWGAAKHDTAEGIHRPLTATAIAIAPTIGPRGSRSDTEGGQAFAPQGTLVLVAVDAGWWQLNDDEWYVRGAVLERYGLDPARVMIAFAHTHAGPSLCPADADKPGGGMIAEYLRYLRDQVVEAAGEAIRSVVPATLTWAYGKCNLATNRDLPEPNGNKLPRSSKNEGERQPVGAPRIVCGFNPNKTAEDTLLVGRITEDATGRIIGTIVNYACHPTTLAWDNKLISPDYVGALHETVERDTGGVPCAFLQGSSGELAPREQYVGDTAIADRNGRQLGYAVLSTLESMLPPRTALEYAGVVESGAPLATWKRVPHEPSKVIAAELIQVPLPLKPWESPEDIERQAAACEDRVMGERLRRKLRVRQSVGTGKTCDQPAWIWRIGDAILVGQPNETYSAFQQALRKACPGAAVVVMNLVNGCVGYLSPADCHDLDIYQVWQCPFDRKALAVLVGACAERMAAMIEASPDK
jgi:hypothetical protein